MCSPQCSALSRYVTCFANIWGLQDVKGATVSASPVPPLAPSEASSHTTLHPSSHTAGLGSEQLLEDRNCVPIRGQVRRVCAPWMKHVWFVDDEYYVIPNVSNVVVGGTQQRGNYNDRVDPVDTERIWTTVTSLWPALSAADVIHDWVRPCLRLLSSLLVVVFVVVLLRAPQTRPNKHWSVMTVQQG